VTTQACTTGARKRTAAARLLLALTALATLFALAPQSAAAGTYVMRSCNVPGQAPAPVGPWAWQHVTATVGFNECAVGGGFGLQFGSTRRTVPRAQYAAIALERPPSGPKSAISIRQARLWLVARLSGSGSPAYAPLRAHSTSGSFQQTETFAPPGGDSLSSPIVTPAYGATTSQLSTMLYCSGGTPEDCYFDSQRPLEIRGAEVTLDESVLPAISLSGGTLLAGPAQSGIRSVGYSASDSESGIVKTEILLDDRVVAVRDFSGDANRCPHANWNACQEDVSDEVSVDTRNVEDGSYVLGARTTDAAGNTAVTRAGSVQVRNQVSAGTVPATAPSAQIGQAPGTPTGIHVTHVNSTQTFVTSRLIRYGSRATLRGVLRDPEGKPIPNAVVDVLLQTERKNSRLRKVISRTTDADGRFEYKTNPGPSRLVRFAYGRSAGDSSYVFAHDIRVRTKAGLTLHVNRNQLRNGQSLRFYGTIRGNKQRKVLEVQVRKPGGWDTIASVRSNSEGRWSWRYRFRRTYESTSYKFRARVRTESGFPYATGHSRSRSVRVR